MTGPTGLPDGIVPGGRHDAWSPTRIRYVVCDVDGTLVGPSELATAEVVAAIARAQDAGIHVGYATGRMRDAVAALHEQLGATGPHVMHNGAEVWDGVDTIAAWPLDPRQVDAVLALGRAHDGLYVEIYTERGYLASALDERARPHWEMLGAPPSGVLERAADLAGRPVLKATFAVFTPAAGAWLTRQLDELDVEVGAAGSPRTPDLTYVNVNRPGTDKGVALHRAADHLGIPMSAVAAIGDATNDLSMLAVVGTAIAMGQAPAQVRAAAHLVVPDVDAHGVAVALDSLAELMRAG